MSTLTRFALVALVLVSMSALVHAQGVTGGDWSTFMLNNNGTRYQPNSTINASNIGSIVQDWKINTGTVTSTPIVVEGNVYFDDWNGGVYDANIITGSTKYPNWQVNLGGNSISSTPEVYNGMVYVTLGPDDPQQPTVYALSQKDGHVVWETMLPTSTNELYASPIIFNGVLYVGVAGDLHDEEVNGNSIGAIFALNSANGNLVWSVNTMIGNEGGAGVWGSVAVDPNLDSIYFGTSNPYVPGTNSLYGYSIMSLNATNGKINWYNQIYKNPNENRISGDFDFGSSANLFSVVINGITYNAVGIGNKNGLYYVLNRVNGQMLENISVAYPLPPDGIRGVGGFVYPSGSPVNPEVFIASSFGNVSEPNAQGIAEAFYPSNGAIAWKFYTPGELTGSVSIIPGAVLFGDNESNLYALNISNGKVLFYKNFSSSILAGITPAEGYILVPLAGVGLGVPQGVVAFSLPTGAPPTTTIPANGRGLAVSVVASNTMPDAGQVETLTATGTNINTSGVYTFYFVSGATGEPVATIYGSKGSCGGITGTATATCTFKEPFGYYSYGVGVTSGAQTANSGILNLSFYGDINNTNGNVPTVTIKSSNTTLAPGGQETFTVKVDGGYGPFGVQIYNVTTGSVPLGGVITINSSGQAATFRFNMPGAAGTYSFMASATDTGASLPFTIASTESQIAVVGSPVSRTGPQNQMFSTTDEIIIGGFIAVIALLLVVILSLNNKLNRKKNRRMYP